MENELLKSVTLSVVQRALAQAAAFLIAGGWITEEQSTKLLLYAAGVVASLAIYVYTYFKNKAAQNLADKQIEVALDSSATTPISVVKAKASQEVAQ